MVYTVTFNPALDYVMRVAHFEPGMTNRTSSEEIQLGGKGINVSCVLKALGVETTALGFVAGFTGRELERSLSERGIRQDFIRLDEGQTRINVKIKGSAETEINAQGPAVSAQALDELMRKLDALGEGDVLVISGSIPLCRTTAMKSCCAGWRAGVCSPWWTPRGICSAMCWATIPS